jgi:hypothetical protein
MIFTLTIGTEKPRKNKSSVVSEALLNFEDTFKERIGKYIQKLIL